jgi:hypothetical protein
MNVKSVAKLLLAFSACFLGASLVGTLGLIKGYLSPRALGIFLALVCLGGFAFLMVTFQRLARERLSQGQGLEAGTAAPSRASYRRQLLLIKLYKAALVGLVLCPVGGVVEGTRVRPIPLFPMFVGITMNLLITWGLVLTIRKLQKSLSEKQIE